MRRRVFVAASWASGASVSARKSWKDGKIFSQTAPRHTHRQWLGFLKHLDEQNPAELTLRLIIDNCGTHKTPKVKTWVKWRNARQRKELGRDLLVPRSAGSSQTCKEAGDWMAVLGW